MQLLIGVKLQIYAGGETLSGGETLAKICVAASLETLRKDPTIRALQKFVITGCWETTQRNL